MIDIHCITDNITFYHIKKSNKHISFSLTKKSKINNKIKLRINKIIDDEIIPKNNLIQDFANDNELEIKFKVSHDNKSISTKINELFSIIKLGKITCSINIRLLFIENKKKFIPYLTDINMIEHEKKSKFSLAFRKIRTSRLR